jgi:hypothetical protein
LIRPAPGVGSDWFSPGRFAILLAGLIFAAFPQVVLGLQSFVARDFGFFAYPLAHYQRECFWRGELPLWNPYNNCGVPFLAQWNTMPLYPLALVYLLLPLNWSLSVFCLLHLFLAGMGMYFLAWRWTGSGCAGAVAGVVFAFNGLSLNLLMWPSHIATLGWMPWVVLSVERAWQEGGRRLVVAALVGALQMLAGGPETILLTWLLLLGLWTLEWVRGLAAGGQATARAQSYLEIPAGRAREDAHPPGQLQLVVRFASVVLLVAGLAAVQLLPFLDLVAHSQREQGYADTRWSMPSWGWANFLVPMLFGSRWEKGVFFQYDQGWTSSYYLGMGALLLALLALWIARGRRVWLLSLAAILGLFLAMGDRSFVYRWARHWVPQLGMITYPVKFVLTIGFAAPLLAGFAFAPLLCSAKEGLRPRGRKVVLLGTALLLLIGVILLWAWRFPFATDDVAATVRNGLSRAAFLAGAVVLLAAIASATKPGHQQVLSLLLVALLWLDVQTHMPPQNPTAPRWIYEPDLARAKLAMQPQPALGTSRAMVSPAAEKQFMQVITSDPKDNFLAKRMGYFADCNLLDAVPKVNGFFSLYPRECGELASVLYGSTNLYLECLADFMSVSQITAPGQFFDWTPRRSFLPMLTAGQRPVYLDDTNALLTLVRPGFDTRRSVILPPEDKLSVSVTNQTAARIAPGRLTAQRIELEVEAEQASLVVFSQTYYHPWHAYIDGEPGRLLRANYAFQAMEIPAGRHRVRLVYRDRAFYLGTAVSILAVSLCTLIWLRSRRPIPMSGLIS